MRVFLLFAALSALLAVPALPQAAGTAQGFWLLDLASSKLIPEMPASSGRAAIYQDRLVVTFAMPKYSFASAYLRTGGGCVQVGHTEGAKCTLKLNDKGGDVSVDSPSGARTAMSWTLSADGKTLTLQYRRNEKDGKVLQATYVYKRAPLS